MVLSAYAHACMHMCIEYWALKKIAVKKRCPLPHIDALIHNLCGAKYLKKKKKTSRDFTLPN
jgi:hypothetical protein